MSAESASRVKPTPLPVLAEHIPPELRRLRQWVCWSYTWTRGKWDKPPRRSSDLSPARPNDPSTWGMFEEGIGRYYAGEVDGVGWVPVDDGADLVLVGIDFDKCRDPASGEITPWASGWIQTLDTYTELSPSGTGIRLFAWGRLPPEGRKRGLVEVYQHHHYLTVTGQHLDGTPLTIEQRPNQLLDLHRHVWPEHHHHPDTDAANGEPGPPHDLDDDELLRRMFASKHGMLLRHLWDGGADDYTSASEADLAFCSRVGWWVRWDKDRVDRLFRRSRRMRAKWERENYRRRTLARACDGKAGGYEPRGRPGHAAQAAPAAAPENRLDGLAIILADFRARYEPRFRRGNAIYSDTLEREVKPAEGCFAADRQLLARLATASNAPFDKHGRVEAAALPRFFWMWSKSAWAELLKTLPEEEGTEEACASAGDTFRRQVAACLGAQAVFAATIDQHGTTEQQRRTLLQWCRLWAKPGAWLQVRAAFVWCRKDDAGRLCVALRRDLFAQYGPRELAALSQRTFARLAEMYGVGTAQRAGGERVIEIAQEFLEALETAPQMEPLTE
jgi:hypothetical protein